MNLPLPDDYAEMIKADALARRYSITPKQARDLSLWEVAASEVAQEYERRMTPKVKGR